MLTTNSVNCLMFPWKEYVFELHYLKSILNCPRNLDTATQRYLWNGKAVTTRNNFAHFFPSHFYFILFFCDIYSRYCFIQIKFHHRRPHSLDAFQQHFDRFITSSQTIEKYACMCFVYA